MERSHQAGSKPRRSRVLLDSRGWHEEGVDGSSIHRERDEIVFRASPSKCTRVGRGTKAAASPLNFQLSPSCALEPCRYLLFRFISNVYPISTAYWTRLLHHYQQPRNSPEKEEKEIGSSPALFARVKRRMEGQRLDRTQRPRGR